MYHAIVKLMNGEELITKVINDDGGHWTFQDPVIMYRHIAPTGMTWLQCSHWLLFNEVSIVRVHKDKVLALVGDLHDNVIANYEKFLQEGYVEMSEKRNSGHEKEKFEQQIDQLVGVGANTTYH
tara:strand:- start:5346 stop:5717 length:372 start_codon:yes stop_codon:yes gene_type:complete